MFTKESYTGSRVQQYETVIKQLDALLTGESNVVANLSNASALLNQFLDRVNCWLLRNRRKSACSWTIPRNACLRAHSIWTRRLRRCS